jgi:hypothetical protein
MFLRLFLIPSFIVILSQCNNGRGPGPLTDGGPCDYDSARFSAEVIDIQKITTHPEDSTVLVKLNMSGRRYRDTITLNQLVHHSIDAGYLRNHHIQTGYTVNGMVFYIKKGTCTPEIYRLDNTGLK